jgi:hypothetical protein
MAIQAVDKVLRMMSKLLGEGRVKVADLPEPLSDFSLSLPEGIVKMRLEMRIRTHEEEAVRLRGANIRTYVDGAISRKVERIEHLKDAYILESKDESRLFVFASKEAASDYIHGQREGRAELQRAREAWSNNRAEAESDLVKTRKELADLEQRIAGAEAKFLDSEGNLSYQRAQSEVGVLGDRIRDLKVKLDKPEPKLDMGTAIAVSFGADEIISRDQIAETVKAERVRLMDEFGGLPRKGSEVSMGRHIILMVDWKQPL